MDIGAIGKSQTMDNLNYDKKILKIKEEIGEIDTKNKESVKQSIDKANRIIKSDSTYLKFEIHEKTHDIMVKIIETETGNVIKEIPSEKIIDMIAEICERAGIFIDKKI